MFCIWWRLLSPRSAWNRHADVYPTEAEASLAVPLVVRIGAGAVECMILPTDETPPE
jgi:hypothetical protein